MVTTLDPTAAATFLIFYSAQATEGRHSSSKQLQNMTNATQDNANFCFTKITLQCPFSLCLFSVKMENYLVWGSTMINKYYITLFG